MSARDIVADLYEKQAPRWFKVIRWKEWGARCVKQQKFHFFLIYLPAFVYYVVDENPYPLQLVLKRPKTEEERMELKQNSTRWIYQRNWELDQYSTQQPPLYDLSVRRKKYPEYYEGRYDNIKIPNIWGEVK